jgi:coiled-coil domain-containing protein 64
LHSDITGLRALLEQTENSQRSAEKEKSLLITQLTEQNQRLTSQLKDSSKIEESLTCELQSMRDQVNHKKTSMTEHVTHLETLRFAQLQSFASSPLLSRRDEITIMTERKLDLERRIEALYSERDGLSTTLDESADRIVMLEKEGREQDSMIRNSKKEINELKATNSALTDRLDSIYRRWECQRN